MKSQEDDESQDNESSRQTGASTNEKSKSESCGDSFKI